jgi:sporulation protein YlmC with PRC-barrel domain
MRLSDILECDMVDDHGERIGRVHDVRVIREGPPQGMFGPSYQIVGLIVGHAGVGTRLGFDRAGVKGPWPLKKLFGRTRRKRQYVEWGMVEEVREGLIRLKVGKEACQAVPELPNE